MAQCREDSPNYYGNIFLLLGDDKYCAILFHLLIFFFCCVFRLLTNNISWKLMVGILVKYSYAFCTAFDTEEGWRQRL